MDDRKKNRLDISRNIDKILLPYLEEYRQKRTIYDGLVPLVDLEGKKIDLRYTYIIVKAFNTMLIKSQERSDYFPAPTDVASVMNNSDTFCNMKIRYDIYTREVKIHFYKSNYTVTRTLSNVKDDIILFIEESITITNRCKFVSIGLGVSSMEGPGHYNLLLAWKNKRTNRYDILVYEPHGYSEPVTFMDTFFSIFTGDRRFNLLKTPYISCPTGLQVKSRDVEGYCIIFSTLILYITLNLLNSPDLSKENKDYLLNIDTHNINLDHIERYIIYDDKYKNDLMGICSVFATKLITFYSRNFIHGTDMYRFMKDILDSEVIEQSRRLKLSFYNLLESVLVVNTKNPSEYFERSDYGHYIFSSIIDEDKDFQDPKHIRIDLDNLRSIYRIRKEAINPNTEPYDPVNPDIPGYQSRYKPNPVDTSPTLLPTLERERSRYSDYDSSDEEYDSTKRY